MTKTMIPKALPAPYSPATRQAGKKCGNCPPLVMPRRAYTPSRPHRVLLGRHHRLEVVQRLPQELAVHRR